MVSFPSTASGSITAVPSPIRQAQRLPPLFRATEHLKQAHPGFVPSWGRVSRGFDTHAGQRVWQAEQILKNFGQWPPREDELYVIQIDQDSPSPPGQAPRDFGRPDFAKRQRTWLEAQLQLQAFVTQYTGQTTLFRARKVQGQIELFELNPAGPLRSSAHPGQLDPAGQASCTGGVCGMAWPRIGVVPFKAKGGGGVFNPIDDTLVKVARDINFDGGIDEEESRLSAASHGLAVQIHPGFPGSPRSVGCQTLPPDHFAVLRKIIEDSGVDKFQYILVKRPNERSGARPW